MSPFAPTPFMPLDDCDTAAFCSRAAWSSLRDILPIPPGLTRDFERADDCWRRLLGVLMIESWQDALGKLIVTSLALAGAAAALRDAELGVDAGSTMSDV